MQGSQTAFWTSSDPATADAWDILILIDGHYRHEMKDGRSVDFVKFPAIEGAPPGVRGAWTITDVQAVLTERMK